jgi:hypothetical protein
MTGVEATAAVAVSLVAAVIVVLAVRAVDRRPSASLVALRYLEAIARGDGATANELFDPSREDYEALGAGVERLSLYTPAALAGAHEHIAAVKVLRTATSRRSPRSFVYYSYELAGATYEGHPLSLRWIEKRWQLESGASQLIEVEPTFETAPTSATMMRIRLGFADCTVDVPPVRRHSFLVYPGRYPINVEVDGWREIPPTVSSEDVTLAAKGAGVLVVPHFAHPAPIGSAP